MSPERVGTRSVEDIGVEQVHSRPIRLFELSGWRWPVGASDTPPFTLFIAANASTTPDERLRQFAATAIASGCRYVCAWGQRDEAVHDAFDAESMAADVFVTSTWHRDAPLHEALYFALVVAIPEEAEAASSPVVLAVEPEWLAEVRALIADQDELARLWTSD
jgi:hypothetical protein